MSAFFMAQVTVKDAEKFQEYAKRAGPTFAAHSGELLTKGKFAGFLNGNGQHNAVAVVKFPSLDHIDNWYQSASYQELIPLRDSAAEVVISKYEVPE